MSRKAEPSGVDDLIVSLRRREDKNFMKDDPRFTEEAMEKRALKGEAKIQSYFSQKFLHDTQQRKTVVK